MVLKSKEIGDSGSILLSFFLNLVVRFRFGFDITDTFADSNSIRYRPTQYVFTGAGLVPRWSRSIRWLV